MRINILVTMAGSGFRFKEAGYKNYKLLVDINGKPMMERVIDNLTPEYRDHHFIFVTLSHYSNKKVFNILRRPNATIIELPHITEGQTASALMAEGLINNDEPLLLTACDQLVDIDIDDYIDYGWKSDACVLTHPSNDLRCSFSVMKGDKVIKQVEKPKTRVSTHANIGPFLFRKGKYFVEAAKKMIKDDFRVNGEFYVAPVLNYMLDKDITIYEIPTEKTHQIGMVDVLQKYMKTHKGVK